MGTQTDIHRYTQTDRQMVRQTEIQRDGQVYIPGINSMIIMIGCLSAAIPINLTMFG